MPRDLPIGNGRLLVNFDGAYQLRDIYYPNVARENQTSGHPSRFGVWVDGALRWVDDEGWRRTLHYLPDTLVTRVRLVHDELQVQLLCNDVVDFHEDVLVRRIVVENMASRPRELRLFFHHDLHIAESAIGDTAYYSPDLKAVVHYKGPRYFLIGGCVGARQGLDQWATGEKEARGRQGTWQDAEDGQLSGNPITQGSVDSCVALHVPLEAGDTEVAYLWLGAATSYDAIKRIHAVLLDKGPQQLLSRTTHFWHLWVNKEDYDYGPLPAELVRLVKRSLLTIQTNVDERGGIIAASDRDITTFNFDTYGYVWPRDGAIVAHALDAAGFSEVARSFFKFCGQVITDEGFFLHKYNADYTLASSWHPWLREGKKVLPIQEDETALVLWALWHHFDLHRDIDVIKPLYRDLIIRAANFLVAYRDERGLPLPSWDLWEERWGVHAFTIGAVHGGLLAASNFAQAFGETTEAQRYRAVAAQLRQACDAHLWREELGRFARALYPREDGGLEVDPVIDSALVGLFSFGMYQARDERLEATLKRVWAELEVKTGVGGIARYTNDYYHQVSGEVGQVPGNPWFICSLWMAQWLIARAEGEQELEPALAVMRWVQGHALPSGILAEQVDPFSGAPLSVSPLTWSHAAYVATVMEYLDKLSDLSFCATCDRPLYTKQDRRLKHERGHHHAPGQQAETLPGQISAAQG